MVESITNPRSKKLKFLIVVNLLFTLIKNMMSILKGSLLSARWKEEEDLVFLDMNRHLADLNKPVEKIGIGA